MNQRHKKAIEEQKKLKNEKHKEVIQKKILDDILQKITEKHRNSLSAAMNDMEKDFEVRKQEANAKLEKKFEKRLVQASNLTPDQLVGVLRKNNYPRKQRISSDSSDSEPRSGLVPTVTTLGSDDFGNSSTQLKGRQLSLGSDSGDIFASRRLSETDPLIGSSIRKHLPPLSEHKK